MAAERDEHGRFLTGNSGGGRKPGARNKLSEQFLEALSNDFDQHGIVAIERMRQEDPVAYIRVIASLVPREAKVASDPVREMTDEELDAAIRALATIVRPSLIEAPGAVGDGEDEDELVH